MGTVIFLGILGLLALAGIALTITAKGRFGATRYDEGPISKKFAFGSAAGVFAALFLIVFLFSSLTNVSARSVGIVTEFGKATGTVNPGLNWVAPWAEVTEFPTSNQVLDMDATDNTDSQKSNPVAVKFKGGGSGNINVNVTWQVQNDDKAVKLWENWKDFDKVTNNLVSPKAQTVIAEVFGAITPEDATNGAKLNDVNADIKTKLNATFALDGISVESVSVKRVDPSPEIQDRINKQVQAQADVERARIEQNRAKIDNETNQLRQQSLTPEALIRTCYDVTDAWNVQKNGPLPASWSCTGAGLPLTKSVG